VVLLSNIEFKRYWFGVLPLHVGYLFETGYYKEPEASPSRDFLCWRRKIKEKDHRSRIFFGPRRRCTTKSCATIWRNSGAAKLLRWCTNESMGSGAAIPPPIFVVPDIAFVELYAHLPQPQQSLATIGGYAARNMQNIAAILTNANQMGEGNANIAYEL
jgi:hypothetical protein